MTEPADPLPTPNPDRSARPSANPQRSETPGAEPHAAVRRAEQDRIAAELGQIVIRRVFAIGLELKSCAAIADAALAERLQTVVDQLDTLITEVRDVVFDQHLSSPPLPGLH